MICAYLGSGLQLFVAGSLFAWLPSYLNRAYGLAPDRAGVAAAGFILLMGVGMIVCGVITDRLTRTHPIRKWTTSLVYASLSLALLPVGFAQDPGPLQLVLIAAGAFFAAGVSGPAGAMVANLTPASIRATAFGTLTLSNNLLGLAAGPVVVGLLADRSGWSTRWPSCRWSRFSRSWRCSSGAGPTPAASSASAPSRRPDTPTERRPGMMLRESHTTVIVPGLRRHVDDHWQTRLAAKLPGAVVVASFDRDKRDLAGRVADLNQVILDAGAPVTIVAHSAGVLTTVHWARKHDLPVRGALLATPPDLARPLPAEYPSLAELEESGWLPIPRNRLRFPSILAASTNDALGDMERVRALADSWGSRFIDIGPVGHLNPASGYGEWPGAEALLDVLGGMRPRVLEPLLREETTR